MDIENQIILLVYFESGGRINHKTTVNAAHLVYTGLMCSITGAESVLNNLCDRKLLVGGTIIQGAIDKTRWKHLSVPNGCACGCI